MKLNLTRKLVGFDTETRLMSQGYLAPELMCATVAHLPTDEEYHGTIQSNGDPGLLPGIHELLTDDSICLVIVNAPFDLAVLANYNPSLIPLIFQALEDERVIDPAILEKEIRLSDEGSLTFRTLPNGSPKRIGYSLNDLLTSYHGQWEDRSEEKKGDDTWRSNYAELDGIPSAEYPEEARRYAIQDAIDHLRIAQAQIASLEGESGAVAAPTHHFHVKVAFALHLASCWGVMIDLEAKAKIVAMLEEELDPSKMQLLLASGVLRPYIPPQAYKNGAKHHEEECTKKDCSCPLKMTKGAKPSINTKILQGIVKDILEGEGTWSDKKHLTETGGVSTTKAIVEEVVHLSPLMEEYQHRQKLQKLVTTEIPRMGDNSGPVHAGFNVLVETGRTSSSSKKDADYPSFNCQNVDPRARGCYVARDEYVFLASDYKGLELVTCAQVTYNILGFSVLRDRLNAGIDAHAYLGAQIAYAVDSDFADYCGEDAEDMEKYKLFMGVKETDATYWKHYRKLAKPTGLGYPGGLGPRKFMTYAKGAPFHVDVDLRTATELQEIWRRTYPEMPLYFDWISSECVDTINSNGPDDTLYSYTTPFGLYRAGATFCAAANGCALQSPGAEGAKLGLYNVQRACYDPSLESVLFGCRMIMFIHDELLMEIPLCSPEKIHEITCEVARLMILSLQKVTPDVRVAVEQALMLRWNKFAESVYDDQGRLTIWTPNN